MKIEMWPLERIKPYPKNPRVNDEAVQAVANSIKEFGWQQPIVVDKDGVIIAGHTRRKAAEVLKFTEAPVLVATNLTPAQIKAYRIADNATGEIATWDKTLMPIELDELVAMGFDMTKLGFNEEDLGAWMSGGVNGGQTDPDDVPLPPDTAVTKPGDIWALGDHRLMCGDSTKADQLDSLLDGAVIHLVNTESH